MKKSKLSAGINILSTPIWKRWPTEERDFTPWLVQNEVDTLSQLVGGPLELVGMEHPVGPFEADAVFRRQDTGGLVIVENYLYMLDHDHIGKALTYAVLLEAESVVWVAGDVRPEHSQAIERLNAIVPSLDLFLVSVRIPVGELSGGYEAAPEFVVHAPASWTMP